MTETVKINFLIGKEKKTIEAPIGASVWEVARENGVPIKGACEGNGVCGTCCVELSKADYAKVGNPAEDEEDTLERVSGVTPTSRLACQMKVTKDMNNINIIVNKKE